MNLQKVLYTTCDMGALVHPFNSSITNIMLLKCPLWEYHSFCSTCENPRISLDSHSEVRFWVEWLRYPIRYRFESDVQTDHVRLPGFEPEFEAWEASVLPLDYSRLTSHGGSGTEPKYVKRSSLFKSSQHERFAELMKQYCPSAAMKSLNFVRL